MTLLLVLTRHPAIISSCAENLRLRSIPPTSTLVMEGIRQQNAAFAFALEQERKRSHNSFLVAVFAEANAPLASAHHHGAMKSAVEAENRALFASASSQPLSSPCMQALEKLLDVPSSSLVDDRPFVWVDPSSTCRVEGGPGRQSVIMNTGRSGHSIVHSLAPLVGNCQWTIQIENHKGPDTWVGICSQRHLDKARGGYADDDSGLGSDVFSFGIHHKKGVRHAGRVLKSGTRWKTRERLKLAYDEAAAQLRFFRNDDLLYTVDGVPSEGMHAAVSSPMGSVKFKTLSYEKLPVTRAPSEDMARFLAALNSVFSTLKSCGASQFVSIIRLIFALDSRKSLAHLKMAVRSVLAPAACRCMCAMSEIQLHKLFEILSLGDIRLIDIIAEMLALQPLQDVMKIFVPLIKSVSLDLLCGKSKMSPSSGLTYLSLMFERVSRGLFSGTLAAFNILTMLLGPEATHSVHDSQNTHCEMMLIPRWVLEGVDPVRAYKQILTFGEHRVATVLGLGWADVRVGGQMHRISAVQAQVLWSLTCQQGLSNRELSELCHVSDAVIDAVLCELNSIGALAQSRSEALSDDTPTVMGSSQLPQTSIHIGSACIDAVFWLCRRIKEANGVLDELEACDACSSATGSPPAVVVSVVIDLIRRGIVHRSRGYLIAPAVGGDAAQISLLPPSASVVHSCTAPWQLIPPFERLVLVKMDDTSPACHSFISSSFSSACVDEAAFKNDLMTTLSELVKHSATRDILAVSSLFQECGSVISFAAKTVFDGDAGQPPELPAFAAMSLEETRVRETCTMCLDEKPVAEFMQPPCGHAKCRQCFTEYFSTAIKDSQTPARALGKQGLSITNLKCSECNALIPLSFFQQVSPGLSTELARVLSSIVISNLVAGQCAFARCVCSAILLAPTQECEAFCSHCGRAASIGNFKRQNLSEAWNHHSDLNSHESLNWKLLNSSGNMDRIGVLRYKPCPQCGVMSTRCGCDSKNIVCDKLDRCPSERCDHMTCAACNMNWCWVCSAKNSSEVRCSRPQSERTDRKERFLAVSNGIQKLTASTATTSFLAAPSVRQRVASRLIRQFFDGDAHHSPLSLNQLQLLPSRQRCAIFLQRIIPLMPLLPSAEFISWSTVHRAATAIQSIPLPELFKALEIQSHSEATVAIATLLKCPLPPAPVPAALRFPPLKKGDRVRRGPNWHWGSQDSSGEGVVTGTSSSTDWWSVKWDSGSSNRCVVSQAADVLALCVR
jgi:hypothetical protein